MATPDLLERREYKYLVPASVVAGLRAALRGFCKLDKNAGSDGTYPIRSLYLDNHDLDLFWANHHEVPRRAKVRVRTYPHWPGTTFLEVKRRILDVVVKSRGRADGAQWVRQVLRPTEAELNADKGLREFVRFVHGRHLEPRCVVEYDREAYESTIDKYARVTFDGNLRCQAIDRWTTEVDPARWRPIDHPLQTWTHESVYVLELKFERTVPRWMCALAQRFDLMRQSYSKYGYSVTTLFPLPGPRPEDRVATWSAR